MMQLMHYLMTAVNITQGDIELEASISFISLYSPRMTQEESVCSGSRSDGKAATKKGQLSIHFIAERERVDRFVSSTECIEASEADDSVALQQSVI